MEGPDGSPPAQGGEGTADSMLSHGNREASRDADAAVFDGFAEEVPAPVVVVDRSGTIVHLNEAVRTRLGYEPAEIVGEPMQTVWPALDVSDFEAHAGAQAGDEYLSERVACDDRDGARIEFGVDEREFRGRPHYVAVVHDVTTHYEHERKRRQFERIVQNIDDGVYVLDDSFNITMVNDAMESMSGYDREELVGASATKLATEETIRNAAAVSDALVGSDASSASLTTTIETADGDELPIETRFSVHEFADGSWGQVGVVRDISDRHRYQETLTALHDSTRELLHAETGTAVAERIAETAADVLDVTRAVVYLYDGDTNVLRPAAIGDGDPHGLDEWSPIPPDEGPLWSAFTTGERQVDRTGAPIELSTDRSVSADNGLFLPLDDHGVFFLAMADDFWTDPGTQELVDLLAASAESGLQRIDRDESLRARDQELREQNQRLRRLKRTNEIIRRIDGAMVDAESREAIETAVCEQLVASTAFTAAWIGRADGDELAPQAWAGDATGYLDAIDLTIAGAGGPPSVRAARSEALVVETSVPADLRSEQWRMEAVRSGYQSAISVPLLTDDAAYGVLTVFASEQSMFGDSMQTVFSELGAKIGNALRVVDTKQWLTADRVTEIELTIDDLDGPLARLANGVRSRLDLEGTVARDSTTAAFVSLPNPARDVAAVAAELTGVTLARSIGDDDTDLYEVCLDAQCIATTVGEHGGRLRSLSIEGGRAELRVELPPTARVREFADALDGTHGDTKLRTRHTLTRPDRDEGGFRAALRDRLSDRQDQMLRTAYLSGFFEWPRTTTGEEIAETFDVSQPTVNRHLRVGLRKCLELVYDR